MADDTNNELLKQNQQILNAILSTLRENTAHEKKKYEEHKIERERGKLGGTASILSDFSPSVRKMFGNTADVIESSMGKVVAKFKKVEEVTEKYSKILEEKEKIERMATIRGRNAAKSLVKLATSSKQASESGEDLDKSLTESKDELERLSTKFGDLIDVNTNNIETLEEFYKAVSKNAEALFDAGEKLATFDKEFSKASSDIREAEKDLYEQGKLQSKKLMAAVVASIAVATPYLTDAANQGQDPFEFFAHGLFDTVQEAISSGMSMPELQAFVSQNRALLQMMKQEGAITGTGDAVERVDEYMSAMRQATNFMGAQLGETTAKTLATSFRLGLNPTVKRTAFVLTEMQDSSLSLAKQFAHLYGGTTEQAIDTLDTLSQNAGFLAAQLGREGITSSLGESFELLRKQSMLTADEFVEMHQKLYSERNKPITSKLVESIFAGMLGKELGLTQREQDLFKQLRFAPESVSAEDMPAALAAQAKLGRLGGTERTDVLATGNIGRGAYLEVLTEKAGAGGIIEDASARAQRRQAFLGRDGNTMEDWRKTMEAESEASKENQNILTNLYGGILSLLSGFRKSPAAALGAGLIDYELFAESVFAGVVAGNLASGPMTMFMGATKSYIASSGKIQKAMAALSATFTKTSTALRSGSLLTGVYKAAGTLSTAIFSSITGAFGLIKGYIVSAYTSGGIFTGMKSAILGAFKGLKGFIVNSFSTGARTAFASFLRFPGFIQNAIGSLVSFMKPLKPILSGLGRFLRLGLHGVLLAVSYEIGNAIGTWLDERFNISDKIGDMLWDARVALFGNPHESNKKMEDKRDGYTKAMEENRNENDSLKEQLRVAKEEGREEDAERLRKEIARQTEELGGKLNLNNSALDRRPVYPVGV